MGAGTPSVDSASAIRSRLASPDSQRQAPGTLTKWADADNNHYWEFVGNGQTSSAEFVRTALQREASEGNAEVQPVAANQAFARAAAVQLLGSENPDEAIPKGEVKELALKDLVRLISPFLQAYAASQKGGAAPPGGPRATGEGSEDERARVATGQVVSHGLTLPLD